MNREEHIRKAENLLESAKEVARRPKETAEDRKNDEIIVLDLIGFVNAHARIAIAIGTEDQARRYCIAHDDYCVRTFGGNCVTHNTMGADAPCKTDGSDYN